MLEREPPLDPRGPVALATYRWGPGHLSLLFLTFFYLPTGTHGRLVRSGAGEGSMMARPRRGAGCGSPVRTSRWPRHREGWPASLPPPHRPRRTVATGV